jgi:hypothetical protein
VCTAHVDAGDTGTGSTQNVKGAVYKKESGNTMWNRVLAQQPYGGSPTPQEALPLSRRDFVHAFAPFYDPHDSTRQTVYVTTRTHGTWVTKDGGASWTEALADVPFLSAQRLTFGYTPGVRHVTTYGGGVWEPAKVPTPTTADVYLRDHVGDTGVTPTAGLLSLSPDIILRQMEVQNPPGAQATYGEGSGTENNGALSQDAEYG